jgi:hypothetical protein
VVELVSRTPPKEVREILRREVNFGCPVHDCGSPYLTWHHFDPPWREKEHHNPEGMIALCATHAGHADGGKWTKEQLVEMKRNPYVTPDKISEYYDYLRKDFVCIVGFVAYNVKNALEINGERVIGFERDSEGYNRLNLLIRDTDGNPVLVMENNFWTADISKLFDLRCSMRGKELEIVSKDNVTKLFMRFDDYPIDYFRDMLMAHSTSENVNRFISNMGSPASVPTWTIKGRLSHGKVNLEIGDFAVEDLTNKNLFAMCFVTNSESAFRFTEGSIEIG